MQFVLKKTAKHFVNVGTHLSPDFLNPDAIQNVRQNSIVQRIRLASILFVSIRVQVTAARTMNVLFSIIEQSAVRKTRIQNVLPTMIVLQIRLVMDINALIRVWIIALQILIAKLLISNRFALAKQDSSKDLTSIVTARAQLWSNLVSQNVRNLNKTIRR